MADNAYVLVADLLGSRRLTNREEAGELIERSLQRVNAGRTADWRAPLITTKGFDELSGVLARPEPAFDIAVAVNEAIWPLRFRFALGIGAIDVAGEGRDAAAMDGPAFHRAAEGIRRAKRGRLPFVIEGDTPPKHADLVEAAAALHALTVSGWPKSVPRIVRPAREGLRQTAIADELGITQQAVSEALRRAGFDELLACESAVRSWLSMLEAAPAAEPNR